MTSNKHIGGNSSELQKRMGGVNDGKQAADFETSRSTNNNAEKSKSPRGASVTRLRAQTLRRDKTTNYRDRLLPRIGSSQENPYNTCIERSSNRRSNPHALHLGRKEKGQDQGTGNLKPPSQSREKRGQGPAESRRAYTRAHAELKRIRTHTRTSCSYHTNTRLAPFMKMGVQRSATMDNDMSSPAPDPLIDESHFLHGRINPGKEENLLLVKEVNVKNERRCVDLFHRSEEVVVPSRTATSPKHTIPSIH
jgi:hypothetical protein